MVDNREDDPPRSRPFTNRRRLLQGVGVAAVGGLAGCSGRARSVTGRSNDDTDNMTSKSDTSNNQQRNSAFNAADVAFLQMMVPHHKAAIQMAKLVPERTAHQKLCNLAKKIIRVQRHEISHMRDLLAEIGKQPTKPGEMNPIVMGMMGMMDPAMMEYLRSLEGTTFDLTFMRMMIPHHKGAVEMSKVVLEDGQSPDVEQLATEIIKGQQAEITQMNLWRAEWTDLDVTWET
jgi:uncharacterized protein (DUF305 family)